MKIYLVLTTKLAIANFLSGKDGALPMLNDNLGDLAHTRFRDAIAASLDVAESLEERSERGAAVVHIEYPDSLHESLAYQGHIRGGVQRDFLGAELWAITREGCAILNREAQFTMSVHPRPLTTRALQARSDAVH
jgi:hypothetical protein